MLELSDIDFTRLLIYYFIVPMWINGLQHIGQTIVFAQQHNLQNRQSRILIGAHIASTIANLIRCLCITNSRCVHHLWWPFVSVAFLHQHPSAQIGTNWSILCVRITIHQRQVHIRCDHRNLLSMMNWIVVIAMQIVIGECAHEIHAFHIGQRVCGIILWHYDRIAGLVCNAFVN